MYCVLERQDMGFGDVKAVFCVQCFFVCFLGSIRKFEVLGEVY